MINVEGLSRGIGTICIFIRHGEKDATQYCLTENGKREIIAFSKKLITLEQSIKIYSSPEKRCVETASIINSVVSEEKNEICCSVFLGKPGIQVRDEAAYTKLTDTMKCRDIFKEWKKGLHPDAMNLPETIREEAMVFFGKTAIPNGITLYISQSGTVACTGYALGLVDYKADSKDWVDFLDGYILRV